MTPYRCIALALALLSGACAAPHAPKPITLKIAAINDLHGWLQPSPERIRVMGPKAPIETAILAGGIAQLAAMVDTLRAQNPNFAFVSAGDLIGASPLLSATFDDEPTIEALNAARLDFHGVGNHEFDRGIAHLQRMQTGGCPAAGCKSGAQFAGARFPFLGANVFSTSGQRLFPAYGIKEYSGVKIAFVGVTLKDTGSMLSPQARAGIDFRDEAETVNALVPVLQRQGVKAIVLLIHQGGINEGGANDCINLRGAILDVVERLDRAVNVVASGHTHQAYVCHIAGKLVTSAGSFGRFVTEIDLRVDGSSHGVISASAINRVVLPDKPGNAEQAALLERYTNLSGPIHRPVGRITAPFSRAPNADGESRLGQLIADAHLAAMRAAGAVVAFMNPGGIRVPLPYKDEGAITFADVYAVYPFDNTLVAMTLTGAQILELLEQQWRAASSRVLAISSGFSYAWDPKAPPGKRVVPGSVTIDGQPLEVGRSYRIAVNSYMASGGDRFNIFTAGKDRTAGRSSRDALADYLRANSPVAPSGERRIRRVD